MLTIVQNEHCCMCGHEEQGPLIDPAELLRLIEKAERCEYVHKWRIAELVKSYLSGDHAPLRKLVGDE